jgi:hypothetical protein
MVNLTAVTVLMFKFQLNWFSRLLEFGFLIALRTLRINRCQSMPWIIDIVRYAAAGLRRASNFENLDMSSASYQSFTW